MSLRSVLSIDVDDTAFKDYKKSFDQYAALVKGLPADFAKQWQVLGQTKTRFDELVAVAVGLTYHSKQHVAVQKEADRLIARQENSWRNIGRITKDFASSIGVATASIIKWIGPLGILSTILGAGGAIFGMDRLAANVSAQRRSAMGLGVTYGQQAAFKLNFSRFADTDTLLGNVSNAHFNRTDPNYTTLLAAGLSPDFISSHSPTEVSIAAMDAIRNKYKGTTDEGFLGTQGRTFGFSDLLGGDQNFIRLVKGNQDEFNQQKRAYTQDAKSLDLDPETQRKYQDFVTNIGRAGDKLETVLIQGLVKLANPIEKLTVSFTTFLSTMINSDAFKLAIDGLTIAFEKLADLINGIDTFLKPLMRAFSNEPETPEKYGMKRGSANERLAKALHLLPENDNAATGKPTFGTLDTSWVTAGGADLSAAAKAISGIEGNYDSIGPATRTGDHGYGRYQVMGSNIAEWTKKYWGAALSTDQFLANHAAQDAVFKGQFGAYAAKYGPEGAARAWFAGPGGMNNPNARDVLGTTVAGYSKKFQSGLGGVTPGFLGASKPEYNEPSIAAHRTSLEDKLRSLGNNPYHELGTRPTVMIHNNTGANTIVTTNQAINN